MTTTFALEGFFDLLKAGVENTWTVTAGDGPARETVCQVPVEWGRTRVASNLNIGQVGRVLVCPGAENGAFGTLSGGKQWPQPISSAASDIDNLETLDLIFRVYIYGRCPDAGASAKLHDHWAFLVMHEVIRQAKLAKHQWGSTSDVRFGPVNEIKPLAQHTLGREWIWQCTIEQPIVDAFDGETDYLNVAPVDAEVTTIVDEGESDTFQVEGEI